MRTAELLGAALGTEVLEAVDGTEPEAPVWVFAERLPGFNVDTLVVSHLPFMGRVAVPLLADDADARVVEFVPGDRWPLQWMLRPTMLVSR